MENVTRGLLLVLTSLLRTFGQSLYGCEEVYRHLYRVGIRI